MEKRKSTTVKLNDSWIHKLNVVIALRCHIEWFFQWKHFKCRNLSFVNSQCRHSFSGSHLRACSQCLTLSSAACQINYCDLVLAWWRATKLLLAFTSRLVDKFLELWKVCDNFSHKTLPIERVLISLTWSPTVNGCCWATNFQLILSGKSRNTPKTNTTWGIISIQLNLPWLFLHENETDQRQNKFQLNWHIE